MAKKQNDACVLGVIEAFQDSFSKEEIKEISDLSEKLNNVKNYAEQTGENVEEQINEFAARQAQGNERRALEEQLRAINQIKTTAIETAQVLDFEAKDHKKSFLESYSSSISGTKFTTKGSRSNVYTRMRRAKASFNTQLVNDLHDADLVKYVNTEGAQEKILNDMNSIRRSRLSSEESAPDQTTDSGKTASIYIKYYDRLESSRRELGLPTPELIDRGFANDHDNEKLNRVPFLMRQKAKLKGEKLFDYKFNNWKDFVLPRLDTKRTFVDAGVDPSNAKEVDRFLKNSFAKLINRDAPMSQRLNLSQKLEASRKLHFNAKGQVEYSSEYGKGSIIKSMNDELGNGFSMAELVKRFGAEPMDNLNGVFNSLNKIDDFKHSEDKGKEFRKLQKRMSGLMNGTTQRIPGTLGAIVNAAKTWEVVTKFAFILPESAQDLANISTEASRLGFNSFEQIGNAMRIATTGLSQEEKEHMSDSFDVFRRTHNGEINAEFGEGGDIADWSKKAMETMFKVSGIERWDHALKTATHAMLGRWFALNKHIDWDSLKASDREILDTYNISKKEYSIISQSASRGVGAKELITPDSVQYIDNDVVRAILKEHGETNLSDNNVNKNKTEIENRMRDYFEDRVDHVIQKGDLVDEQILHFGYEGENKWALAALKMVGQFKMFGLSFTRKNLREMLYAKGAKNLNEALWGGKANKIGVLQLMIKMGAIGYASNSLISLAEGNSPPSLGKFRTWTDLLADSTGILGRMASQFDPSDPVSSIGKELVGAPVTETLGDIVKTSDAGFQVWRGTKTPNNAKKLLYSTMYKNVPFAKQIFSKGILDYAFYHWLNETVAPGSLRKHAQQMKEQYGNHPF